MTLAYLSIKETLAVIDMNVFSFWMLGHIMYAVTLAYTYEKSPYLR